MRGTTIPLAAALVLAHSVVASGQDYTITEQTGLYEAPPVDATDLKLDSFYEPGVVLTLPFEFPYYGKLYSSIGVTTAGFIQPDGAGALFNQQSI